MLNIRLLLGLYILLSDISPRLITMSVTSMKKISQILPPQRKHWVGDGFLVTPVFGKKAFTNDVSPFLMFDYAAPREVEPSPKGHQEGVGPHPHRGFETVTILWQGESEHLDSTGSSGLLKSGDVQWMTAGSGVVHSEFLSENFMKKGGILEAAQLWVNLPAKFKMTDPSYQTIEASTIPTAPLEGDVGSIRIIAGQYKDLKGPARTFTPLNVLDISLTKGKLFNLEIPDSYNTILFVRKGSISYGESAQVMEAPQIALMSESGSSIAVTALDDDTSILVLSGVPLNEPIANHGPFVMNTKSEIMQAFEDYQNGQLVRNREGAFQYEL